ncbi:Organic cation transporter protein [Fasciola gigantica]|uniref:Organic cation transporter protein n=1 Tax=Fasciola gigantica TaxID=46835 RepID=A0A504YN13_FASGI|nr:Organic cation transporter protein [Fasciola gigantica]
MCATPELNKNNCDRKHVFLNCEKPRDRKQSKNSQDQDGVNVDRLLEDTVGSCGLWQWGLVLLIGLSCGSIATFPVFANSAARHRCRLEPHVEQFIQDNQLSFDHVASRIGPWIENPIEDNHQNRTVSFDIGCSVYKVNWTAVNLTWYFHEISRTHLNSLETELCPRGYVHEDSPLHYPNSVIEDFGTVCDRSWLVPLGTAIYMLGMLLGFMCGGWCGDRFGRRRTILAMSFVDFACGVWTCAAPNYIHYVIARGLMGIGNTGKGSVANVFILEITVARHRAILSALPGFTTHFLFRALMALCAYLIPDWRWLYFTVWSPTLLSITYVYLLPESPRWLVSQGRSEEAVDVLKTAYRVNHMCRSKMHEEEDFAHLERLKTNPICVIEPEKKKSVLRPLVEREFRKRTCLCIVIVFGVCMSFFGLLFYARVVWNYVYLISLLNSITAIPAIILFTVVYRFCRHRKKPLLISMSVALLVLLISSAYTMIARPNTDTVITICSNIALVLINAALSMCFVYVPELYPSELRTNGSGLVMGISRIGGILCSFVNELDRLFIHGVPLAVYSGVLLLVVVALCLLDDTTGENLPDVSEKHAQSRTRIIPTESMQPEDQKQTKECPNLQQVSL